MSRRRSTPRRDALAEWLTEKIGQPRNGMWWLDYSLGIERSYDGAGRPSYAAASFGADHGRDWEQEFNTPREVREFVKAELEGGE